MSNYHFLGLLAIYTLVYLILVFATLADGHGTFLFATPLFFWLLFLISFMLIPYVRNRVARAAIVGCISVFYLGTIGIAVIEQTGEGNFHRTLALANRNPLLVAVTAVWFLSGQGIFWYLLFRQLRETRGVR